MNSKTESPQNQSEKTSIPKQSIRKLVNRLAYVLEKELSPGDLAELRRLDPLDPACPAFWKVATLYLDGTPWMPFEGPYRDVSEQRWAAILGSMAYTTGLHRPGRRLGAALADAGFSELRFVRLLRASGRALLDAVALTARFLSAKGESFDCYDVTSLVLSDKRDHGESERRRIARDYYRSFHRRSET